MRASLIGHDWIYANLNEKSTNDGMNSSLLNIHSPIQVQTQMKIWTLGDVLSQNADLLSQPNYYRPFK